MIKTRNNYNKNICIIGKCFVTLDHINYKNLNNGNQDKTGNIYR